MKQTVLIMAMLLTVLAGCSKQDEARTADGRLIIKMADGHPDRKSGLGAVLEQINAEFKTAHPDTEIIVESYTDQPLQEKVKIYATANQLPDIIKYWSFDQYMRPLIDAGMIASLNEADFSSYPWIEGALDSNRYNGNLYGIPATIDMWVLYVNKALFEQAGLPLPTSWEDIINSAPAFQSLGIIPVVTNGKEGWPLCEMFDNIAQRISGDFTHVDRALKRTAKFTDPEFMQAAEYIQNLVRQGVFQSNLSTSDYGDARNLFGQERAAMYMSGSWEMSLATDSNFSDRFRENLDVIPFPIISGGRGLATDTLSWFGGTFIIRAGSANQDLLVDYLKLISDRFGELCWQTQAAFPAVRVDARPEDTAVGKKLLQIAAESTSSSGTPALDRSTSVFKEDMQELMRQLSTLIITPQVFCERLDAAAEETAQAQ